MNNFDFLFHISSATDRAARLLAVESMAEKLGISTTEAELRLYAQEHGLNQENPNGKAD